MSARVRVHFGWVALLFTETQWQAKNTRSQRELALNLAEAEPTLVEVATDFVALLFNATEWSIYKEHLGMSTQIKSWLWLKDVT